MGTTLSVIADYNRRHVVFKADFAGPFCGGIDRLLKNRLAGSRPAPLTFRQQMPERDLARLRIVGETSDNSIGQHNNLVTRFEGQNPLPDGDIRILFIENSSAKHDFSLVGNNDIRFMATSDEDARGLTRACIAQEAVREIQRGIGDTHSIRYIEHLGEPRLEASTTSPGEVSSPESLNNLGVRNPLA